jgi:hypothetical protein
MANFLGDARGRGADLDGSSLRAGSRRTPPRVTRFLNRAQNLKKYTVNLSSVGELPLPPRSAKMNTASVAGHDRADHGGGRRSEGSKFGNHPVRLFAR